MVDLLVMMGWDVHEGLKMCRFVCIHLSFVLDRSHVLLSSFALDLLLACYSPPLEITFSVLCQRHSPVPSSSRICRLESSFSKSIPETKQGYKFFTIRTCGCCHKRQFLHNRSLIVLFPLGSLLLLLNQAVAKLSSESRKFK